MLAHGTGKAHLAYLWANAGGAFEDMRAVVYTFTESRSGQHSRSFLGHGTGDAWKGSLFATTTPATRRFSSASIWSSRGETGVRSRRWPDRTAGLRATPRWCSPPILGELIAQVSVLAPRIRLMNCSHSPRRERH